jgi:DNA processing protein
MAMKPESRLTDQQRFDWLRLVRSENVGPRTFRALITNCGGAGAALKALPDLARRGGASREIRVAAAEDIERELIAARKLGVRFVALGEPDYPPLLRQIDSAPPILALRGRAEALRTAAVAIVGSRNASAAGLTFAERLARGLGQAGYVVVSGLARGIDQRAHVASLETGAVGVLAGGHGKPYPGDAVPLMERMVELGAVVSEMPIEWEPRGRDFPRRNRIVSGLALGTVVIEAARGSGSLITARFAVEQNRQVFAVPGSPLDPRAEGTNDLLKQGATICTGADDVLTALEPVRTNDLAAMLEAGGESGEPLWGEHPLFGVDPAIPGRRRIRRRGRRGLQERRRCRGRAQAHHRAARPFADNPRRAQPSRRRFGARGASGAARARARRADRIFRRAGRLAADRGRNLRRAAFQSSELLAYGWRSPAAVG